MEGRINQRIKNIIITKINQFIYDCFFFSLPFSKDNKDETNEFDLFFVHDIITRLMYIYVRKLMLRKTL